MPGFTREEREIVANLCRYHRKALPAPEHSNLQLLDTEGRRAVTLLNPVIRMADSLDFWQPRATGPLRGLQNP